MLNCRLCIARDGEDAHVSNKCIDCFRHGQRKVKSYATRSRGARRPRCRRRRRARSRGRILGPFNLKQEVRVAAEGELHRMPKAGTVQ